jgi:hypothetical protein
MISEKTLIYRFSLSFVHYFGLITKLVTACYLLGVFIDKPYLYLVIHFIVKLVIALYLIYRFNPYHSDNMVFTELDRKVCYSAGTYILFFSFLDLIDQYIEKIRRSIQPYSQPIIARIKNYLLHW